MKKIFLSTALLSSLLLSNEITNKTFEELATFKQNSIKVDEFEVLDTLYVVKGSKKTKRGEKVVSVCVSKDFKYTFFGKTIDNTTGEKVYIKKSPLPYKSDANFTYGTGKEEYFIFTDPQCPYCKKFEQQLEKLNIKDKVKIYYFLYPLPFHKEAVPMSRYILSQKDNTTKLKAVHKIFVESSTIYKKQNYTKDEIKHLDKKIALMKNITKDLGVSGTPTILKSDGTRINAIKFFKEYDGK